MPKRVRRLFHPGVQTGPSVSMKTGMACRSQADCDPHTETQRRGSHAASSQAQASGNGPVSWESIFQAIGSPTLILDRDFNILQANQAALSATHSHLEQLLGKKCYHVFHSHRRRKNVKGCPMSKLLSTKTLVSSEMEVEVLGDTFLVSCTPILDENNEVSQIIHIATPITEHKRVTTELERKNRYLTQLNEFAIKLSHLGEQGDLEELIASELQRLSGALALTITSYNQQDKCLYVNKLYGESWIVKQLRSMMETGP